MRKCPFCAEQIPDTVTRCPYCESDLTGSPPAGEQPAAAPNSPDPSPVTGWATGGSTEPASGWATGQPSAPPPGQPSAPRAVGEGAIAFSHSGTTYILGWGSTFFGIWHRNMPGGPMRTLPRTDDGWRDAWLEYTRIESNFVPVAQQSS